MVRRALLIATVLLVGSASLPGRAAVPLLSPGNDDFEHATPVEAIPFAATTDAGYATSEPGEPTCYLSSKTVWYSYTPPAGSDLDVTFKAQRTGGVAFSVTLSAYTGSLLPLLTQIACDGGSGLAEIGFRALGGTTYWISVAGDPNGLSDLLAFGASMPITLDASFGGRIVGTVTDEATGLPLAGACVEANRNGRETQAVTAADGTYVQAGLAAGTYYVRFGCWNTQYFPERYADRSLYETGDTVAITAGSTVIANAGLRRGSTIAGRVTSPDGPVTSGCLTASRVGGGNGASVSVAPDGTFRVMPLEAATYRLEFGCNRDFQSRWYPDEPGPTTSPAINVGAGLDLTGYDLIAHHHPVPVNDMAADAMEIVSLPFSHSLSTSRATTEVTEPQTCGPLTHTAWYRFTPTHTMHIVAEPEVTWFFPRWAVHASAAAPLGQPSAGMVETFCSSRAGVTYWGPADLDLAGGVTYYFQVGGTGDGGYGDLTFTLRQA
jgi:hypothetical protein